MYKFAIALFLAAVEANDVEGWNEAPPKKWADSYSWNPKPKAYSYSWNPKPKVDYWEYNPKPRQSSYTYNPKPLQSDWKDGDGYSHKSGLICQNGVCK